MDEAFNIYYINNEKATEIALLFDNKILEEIRRINTKGMSASASAGASTEQLTKIPVIGQLLPSVDLNGDLSNNKAEQVEDTIKVITSKSTILQLVASKAKTVTGKEELKPGDLVKVKDVSLTVANFSDVIGIRALLSGLLSQVPVEGIGKMDFTSLIRVIFKDAAYVLYGELGVEFGDNKYLMLKIPMSANNEMESQYSISDLEIGKVTIIGVYRGLYKRSIVERKINMLMSLKDNSMHDESSQSGVNNVSDIENGLSQEEKSDNQKTDVSEQMVHYVDVIAIIQDISI